MPQPPDEFDNLSLSNKQTFINAGIVLRDETSFELAQARQWLWAAQSYFDPETTLLVAEVFIQFVHCLRAGDNLLTDDDTLLYLFLERLALPDRDWDPHNIAIPEASSVGMMYTEPPLYKSVKQILVELAGNSEGKPHPLLALACSNDYCKMDAALSIFFTRLEDIETSIYHNFSNFSIHHLFPIASSFLALALGPLLVHNQWSPSACRKLYLAWWSTIDFSNKNVEVPTLLARALLHIMPETLGVAIALFKFDKEPSLSCRSLFPMPWRACNKQTLLKTIFAYLEPKSGNDDKWRLLSQLIQAYHPELFAVLTLSMTVYGPLIVQKEVQTTIIKAEPIFGGGQTEDNLELPQDV